MTYEKFMHEPLLMYEDLMTHEMQHGPASPPAFTDATDKHEQISSDTTESLRMALSCCLMINMINLVFYKWQLVM